jgi:hypothetical protein
MSTDEAEATTIDSSSSTSGDTSGTTGTTTDTFGEDTFIPPYAGAFPGPDDEGQVEGGADGGTTG